MTKPDSSTAAPSGPFFRPRRLAHVNLWCRNVERVAAFYRDVGGVHEVYRRPAIEGIFLSNGNTYHDLAFMDVDGPIGDGAQPRLHHFAFELETEVDLVAGYEAAKAAGIDFTASMSADVAHSVYLDDPNGNGVELYADVVSDWRALRSGTITKPKAGWTPGSTPPVAEPRYPTAVTIESVAGAVFSTGRTAHVTLVSDNYEAAFAFYIHVIGLQPLVGGLASDFCVLSGSLGDPCLSLFRAAEGRAVGLHHIGFELIGADAVDRAMQRLKADRRDPLLIDHPARRCIHVRDPDGTRLQFFEPSERFIDAIAAVEADLAIHLA